MSEFGFFNLKMNGFINLDKTRSSQGFELEIRRYLKCLGLQTKARSAAADGTESPVRHIGAHEYPSLMTCLKTMIF